ncbi:MAG: putative metalloprotease CJM1_0395 family protein [Pseudomonadales bacterium]
MNTVGINTSALANAVTPFSPVGKQAIGLENAEAKEEIFAPIEEPPIIAKAFNRENEAEEARQEQSDQRVKKRTEQQQQQQDQNQIRALSARDREVRAHEQAHTSVGGQYAGSPSFSFERGPDGVNYAVGGEVPISLPSGDDPQATLVAAQQVREAALAPANPSSVDRSIANQASQLVTDARAAIGGQQAAEQAIQREQAEAERVEAQQQGEKEQEEQLERQAREEQLAELRQAARRSTQLNTQLVTEDNIQQNIGSVLDQLA